MIHRRDEPRDVRPEDGGAPGERPARDPGEVEGFLGFAATLAAEIPRIAEGVSTLLAIRVDRARAATRATLVAACAGALVALGLAVAIATASWRLVSGACDALAATLPGPAGVGDLAGGALVLAVIALAARGGWTWREARELRRKEAEYAERHERRARRGGAGADADTPASD